MIPKELQNLPQWVVAGANKVPLNPRTLRHASVTDSRTWSTYQHAAQVAQEHELFLGFVFTEDDPYVGIDLDDPQTDEQRTRHSQILKDVVTYTETSISGKGLHLIARGSIPHAVKRERVEIYGKERYFVMTGKTVSGRTSTIKDCNAAINSWVQQLGGPKQTLTGTPHYNQLPREDDAVVIQRCSDAKNGAWFQQLWRGDISGYKSQSEADFALINALAFMSPNNEQVARLFRQSSLGQRNKAQREDYISNMLNTIRAEQHPPVDFSQFKAPAVLTETTPDRSTPTTYPDGLMGELAQYIYDTAIRPIPQVALVGALGLMAGVAGRSYNISNTGLNLYLMLVAGTAIGKEGAAQGVRRIVQAAAHQLPAIQQFLGPTEYASGQALIKQLHEFPCQLSILSEFGHTLKRICRTDATGADVMWRKVLLDVYNKSGANDILGSMVYSDSGKNTPIVQAPALTLLTESSPAALYEGLDEYAIETGLVPRFLLMECPTQRPPSNPQAFAAPPASLTQQVHALAHRCLSMGANNQRVTVAMAPAAARLMAEFDLEVDDHINAQMDDTIRQIWSRAHMKALRVAALIAIGLDVDKPCIQHATAAWAIDLVRQDSQNMLRRFGEGVGGGDPVQLSQLRQIIINVLQTTQGTSKKMKEHHVVTHRQLSQRAYVLTCFRQDRRGAGEALKRALQTLVDCGELIVLSPSDTRQHFGTTAKCYMATDSLGR